MKVTRRSFLQTLAAIGIGGSATKAAQARKPDLYIGPANEFVAKMEVKVESLHPVLRDFDRVPVCDDGIKRFRALIVAENPKEAMVELTQGFENFFDERGEETYQFSSYPSLGDRLRVIGEHTALDVHVVHPSVRYSNLYGFELTKAYEKVNWQTGREIPAMPEGLNSTLRSRELRYPAIRHGVHTDELMAAVRIFPGGYIESY